MPKASAQNRQSVSNSVVVQRDAVLRKSILSLLDTRGLYRFPPTVAREADCAENVQRLVATGAAMSAINQPRP